MYLIPIHVPIYISDGQPRIGTEWKRALELLRDSMNGRFGNLCVLAPSLQADPVTAEQTLEAATVESDGMELVPSFDFHLPTTRYWLRRAHWRWKRQLASLLTRAHVVHATAGDAFRPYCYTALRMAVDACVPSVFVLDQDIVARMQREQKSLHGLRRLESALHARLYDWQCRRAAKHADMVLLKGRTTMDRYAPYADPRFVHQIEDTSYLSREIIREAEMEHRVNELLTLPNRPLRLAFCGRLVDIKGVDDSLRLIAQARLAGANIEFDVIGGGPELPRLKQLAQELMIGPVVRFHGAMPYGPDLLATLARSDALLFTPRIEETPRMIFDGYAAGLPLVARAIDYAVERADADGAAVLMPRDPLEMDGSVAILVGLDRNRQRLATLTTMAMRAAKRHAADNWYRQRADWTMEMVEYHRTNHRLQARQVR